jgi:hypothetical protein
MSKFILCIISTFLVAILSLSSVQAARVALVVKNSTTLSSEHEKKINNVLLSMGFDVIPIDKNSAIDYSQFDLIVIAGRPGNVYSYEHLDSFVADLPVNDYPTVAIDSSYLDDWGWILPGGISTLSSTLKQRVKIVDDSTSITKGYSIGDIVEVHILAGRTIVDIVKGKYKLKPIASLPTNEDNAIIAVAESGTKLYNNKTTKARVVFFGITYPIYWSDDAINLFKNAVNWTLSDSDNDGIYDFRDNCPFTFNPDQKDTDGDKKGDVCDNCPFTFNPDQADMDSDGLGDLCDDDIDGDGIPNYLDNCPLKFNPDQKDKDSNGIGDVCDVLPYQVFLDVDNDGINETAINANNITDDGFEIYRDPNSNSNALAIDGDFDGMTDWLIDMIPYGTYDKYWDPDDEILTRVNRTDYDYYIDTNNDNVTDIIYNSKYRAFIAKLDVDSDSNLEIALDTDFDGCYEDYKDLDSSSQLLDRVDGDKDKKNDFIISLKDNITKPAKYWDPDSKISTDIVEKDVDNDNDLEFVIDVNGDGKFERVYDKGILYDLPDIVTYSISTIPSSPTEGDNIEIIATIKNLGCYNANNFLVEFKLDRISLVNKTISLSYGSSIELRFNWTAQVGTHTIEIISDPQNTIVESNEENNLKSISLVVSSRFPVAPVRDPSPDVIVLIPSGNASFRDFPVKVELEVGSNASISGRFGNNLNYDLYNVTFNLEGEGLKPEWYSIYPKEYRKIAENESKSIVIEFYIPEDAEIYTYTLTLKAEADSIHGKKTYSHGFVLMFKEKVETTTTTTFLPTTTTIKEEKTSPLTGFYAFFKENSTLLVIVIVVIILIIIWKVFKIRIEFVGKKGHYVYGKGWITIQRFKFLSVSSLKNLLTKW